MPIEGINSNPIQTIGNNPINVSNIGIGGPSVIPTINPPVTKSVEVPVVRGLELPVILMPDTGIKYPVINVPTQQELPLLKRQLLLQKFQQINHNLQFQFMESILIYLTLLLLLRLVLSQ